MSIYARMLGDELLPSRISAHAFCVAFGELERGKITLAQIATLFQLSPAEQAQVATLAAKTVSPVETVSLAGRTPLSNLGTTPVVCGLSSVEAAGITGVEFTVFINRNGASSLLTFRLSDATAGLPGTQIAAVIDTAGTGDKMLTPQLVTLPQPLQPGIKRLVMHAFAGNATDDPIVLGSTLMIRRAESLSSAILHDIAMLACWDHDHGNVIGLGTAAGFQARLGV